MKLLMRPLLGLILLVITARAAAPVHDSKLDFPVGPTQPAGPWRYQSADYANTTGPYADVTFWNAAGCWQLASSWPPYVFFFPETMHPEISQDAMVSFLPPSRGTYAAMGAVKPGKSIQFTMTRGEAGAADTVLGASPTSIDRRWGVFRVLTITNAVTPEASEGQLHMRVNSLGDNANDGTDYRLRLIKLGTEPAPAGYRTSVMETFGSGKPVPSGEGLGQLGDLDPQGNPVWFYQAGMPGQSANYELLAKWEGTQYSSTARDGDWAWCIVGPDWVHPGPSEANSTVITWCSPYRTMKAAITCTASDTDGGGGDGVLVRIYKNDELLPDCTLDIPNGGAGGTIGMAGLEINPGDCLHVAVSCKESHYGDSTFVSVTVTGEPAHAGSLVLIQ